MMVNCSSGKFILNVVVDNYKDALYLLWFWTTWKNETTWYNSFYTYVLNTYYENSRQLCNINANIKVIT